MKIQKDWKIEESVIDEIFDFTKHQISNILPSEWAEQNRMMTSVSSRKEGMLSYENSPYNREIIDHLHPSSPYKIIAVKKGAQLGITKTVVEPGIGWIMSEVPGNTLFLVGHTMLFKDAVISLDDMIDSSGIREKKIIQSGSSKAINNKKGDNDGLKEFTGGFLKIAPSNIDALRQISLRYGFIDDYDIMKSTSKKAGAILPLLMQRFNSYNEVMKLYLLSSPELKGHSNIEDIYLKGDQRKYHIPCPCCDELIRIEWDIKSEVDENRNVGITWELDDDSRLIEDSVGYICYKCDGFFTDQNKSEWLLEEGRGGRAKWIPTELNPLDKDVVSYEVNSLIGSSFMFGWVKYVKRYLSACPPNQPRNESEYQTFVNTVLGLTYEGTTEELDSSILKQNQRPYLPGIIPESLSISDGNGRIAMLTIGADMNGKVKDEKWKHDEDDARLDWEIVAWSENGTSYSIDHGSIGTFQGQSVRDLSTHNHPDRVKWSYKMGDKNCVWDEFDKIISAKYDTDTNKRMSILAIGLDSAPYTNYSYPYMKSNKAVIGTKGDKLQGSGIFIDADYKPFMIAKEKNDLWILNVNKYKDNLANLCGLIWEIKKTNVQPAGFLNFPQSIDGKYSDKNYFSHFEAEHKVVDAKSNKFIWQKKSASDQNHIFDCRILNMAAKDIFIHKFFEAMKIKDWRKKDWSDFVKMIFG